MAIMEGVSHALKAPTTMSTVLRAHALAARQGSQRFQLGRHPPQPAQVRGALVGVPL